MKRKIGYTGEPLRLGIVNKRLQKVTHDIKTKTLSNEDRESLLNKWERLRERKYRIMRRIEHEDMKFKISGKSKIY